MNNDEIIVVSDTHISQIWEKADKLIPKKYNFLNSNSFLRKLVEKIEPQQKLILNGDLTDYNYFKKEHKNNNLSLLLEILSHCRGNYYCNIGNHDYRRLPYSWKFYGIRQNNTSRAMNRRYLNDLATNHYNIFKDFLAYQVNTDHLDPQKDLPFNLNYYKIFNHSEIVLLNSGFDYMGKVTNFFRRKTLSLLLNYRLLFFDPPIAVGLSNDQISFLKDRLENSPRSEVIIFLHHPVFFSFQELPEISVNPKNYLEQREKYRLETGIFLKNNLEFMEAIFKTKKNVIVVTSHVHTAKQYLWDKKKGTLKQCDIQEINKQRDNQKCVKFLSTWPLGAIGTPFGVYKNPDKIVGYLKISDTIEYIRMKDFTNNANV